MCERDRERMGERKRPQTGSEDSSIELRGRGHRRDLRIAALSLEEEATDGI